MAELSVDLLPSGVSVFANVVCVSPEETLFVNADFASINNITYKCTRDPSIKPGHIGMNAKQRECTGAAQGMPLQVRPEEIIANCFSARLEVSLHGEKTRVTVREDDVVSFFKTHYQGHPLSKKQVFMVKMGVATLIITVKESQIPVEGQSENGDISQHGTGLLHKSTEVSMVCSGNNSKLIWEETKKKKASRLLQPGWKFQDMGIGGLDVEFSSIFRRAFASRVVSPEMIESLGIKHVKGMLLYGPPGTGKTLIARQIGKMLAGKEPKVVNGPEVLSKFVGQAEENIRKLFEDAEKDYAENGENAELHIIILDELDAICKQRGSVSNGTGVHDTVVNQFLSKIDGVNSINNILVIGMTNRMDMIDDALLRPGRLEVKIEIGLPDEKGRLDIFKIHTKKMREAGYLSQDVSLPKLAEMSKNYSGAEIQGVVNCASSYAMYGCIDVTKSDGFQDKKLDMEAVSVTMDDFERALLEVKPAFGVADEELKNYLRGDIIEWGSPFLKLRATVRTLMEQLRTSAATSLLSVLLEGPSGCGKTSLAASLALESHMPYVKVISPDAYIGHSEQGTCAQIHKVFENAYKSPLSMIIIDNLERLLDYVPIGPRFSNGVLQTLHVLVNKPPPHEGRKLLVVATTNNSSLLEQMSFRDAFDVMLDVPQLEDYNHVEAVIAHQCQRLNMSHSDQEVRELAATSPLPGSVKQLLMVVELARQDDKLEPARLRSCFRDMRLI